MTSSDDIKDKLQKALQASYIHVDDLSPNMCGTSFNVVIVSELFVGKSRLEQQRMVNDAIAEEMKSIHAFTQKTYTPAAWEKKNKT